MALTLSIQSAGSAAGESAEAWRGGTVHPLRQGASDRHVHLVQEGPWSGC